jgi:uracil-DNA glycosylase
MGKAKELQLIAEEIAACCICKKGCTGKPVPGEGSPDARVVFVGEAPGREEAKTGRPFVGRSGKLLRQMIREIGLDERDVFITSPVHYLPLRGTPSKDMVLHGREYLFRQIAVIQPEFVVLLGATATLALLDRKAAVAKEHGTVVEQDGRKCLVAVHPAYAIRFQKGRDLLARDFQKLRTLLRS